jgi:DNA-binding SARP family transcriptional activator
VDIGILGTVAVTIGERCSGVRANKVRAMLGVLVLDAGRAISHVELAEELWSDHPLGNVRNALQAQASRLRRVLDQPGQPPGRTVLRSVNNGYLLDVPRQSVDANRFIDLAAQGSATLRRDPVRALGVLESALGLWRGPALLDAGDGMRCRSAAALFDERRLGVWQDMASAWMAVGDERRAIAELTGLVSQYPLREPFCDQLMLALYRDGRQGDALEAYHRTRQVLGEEMGLQPGAQLQRRYAQILAHDPVLDSPTALRPHQSESDQLALSAV